MQFCLTLQPPERLEKERFPEIEKITIHNIPASYGLTGSGPPEHRGKTVRSHY